MPGTGSIHYVTGVLRGSREGRGPSEPALSLILGVSLPRPGQALPARPCPPSSSGPYGQYVPPGSCRRETLEHLVMVWEASAADGLASQGLLAPGRPLSLKVKALGLCRAFPRAGAYGLPTLRSDFISLSAQAPGQGSVSLLRGHYMGHAPHPGQPRSLLATLGEWDMGLLRLYGLAMGGKLAMALASCRFTVGEPIMAVASDLRPEWLSRAGSRAFLAGEGENFLSLWPNGRARAVRPSGPMALAAPEEKAF